MGCLIQLTLKGISPSDEEEMFKVLASFRGGLFGQKLDIVSKEVVDGRLEIGAYVPWNEEVTSMKLHAIKRDNKKYVHKAKLIC